MAARHNWFQKRTASELKTEEVKYWVVLIAALATLT
jgi:hypothetical protein